LKKNNSLENKKKMTLVLDYLILCSFIFGLITALYIGLKTIKLI